MEGWAIALLVLILFILAIAFATVITKLYFPKRLTSSHDVIEEKKALLNHSPHMESGYQSQTDGEGYKFVTGENRVTRSPSVDSVRSDCSVMEMQPDVSSLGQLEVGFEYDRESSELIVSVIQARDLSAFGKAVSANYCVTATVTAEKGVNVFKTEVTTWKETNLMFLQRFSYPVEVYQLEKVKVTFLLMIMNDNNTFSSIGDSEIHVGDLELLKAIRLWLNLRDKDDVVESFGDILFSLAYLPTAERLTLVIVKAKNLKFSEAEKVSGDILVKAIMLQNKKLIASKTTSVKKNESQPAYNEAMLFNVPHSILSQIQIRITVAEVQAIDQHHSIGHVIVGADTGGPELSHWQQMLSTVRRPVAMWHHLRRHSKHRRSSSSIDAKDECLK